VVSASLLGTLVTVAGLRLPDVVLRPLEILAGAAAPLALFALGMSLSGESVAAPPRVASRAPELSMVTVAKLVLQPLAAYAAARWLFNLHGVDLIAVTIFAGLPTAQNVFVYATQYNVPNGLSRDAVLVTSIFSLLSLSAILWLLSA
jgi:malonate transporter and related proteins